MLNDENAVPNQLREVVDGGKKANAVKKAKSVEEM